jgi:putative PEP-CTERM system histidine kinase
MELLKTIADQAAAGLLNIKLSEALVGAKEMEAFQSLSAFFVHDLKNLASRLSLTLQNLPTHYEDPAFRKDLLRVISQSVENINSMCSRLSPLSQVLELKPTETDLNELVGGTVESLNNSVRAQLVQDLQPVPGMRIDPEQIQKVLINLVLNADEATGEDGEIRVATEDRNGWTVLTVSDDGCGMSKDFMARSLFKAFQTTKKRGLGIGLFHCKKIVETHGGRIEVESEEGKGSTFRVVLPRGVR